METKTEERQSPLATAFVAAQLELENPKFDCVNPHFRNRYASLSAIRKAVIPVFAKHGISVTQNITTKENMVGCETIYRHRSGEALVFGPLFIPVSKMDAQGFGSGTTYACRYGLSSSAGVVGEEDDDGEAAVSRGSAAAPAAPVFKLKKEAAPNEAQKLLVELGEKMAEQTMVAGHVRAFLDSKNSWPKDAKKLGDLPVNILARLLVPTVWAEVVAFVPKPEEVNA